MIKYAERGLVSDGFLKDLIKYLYYLANIFFWCYGLALDFSKYLKIGVKAEEEMKFLKICSKKVEGGSHILLVNFFLIICGLILPAAILAKSVNHFIKRNMSKKFGDYQRNMVTFKQTMMSFNGSIFLLFMLMLLLRVMEDLNFSRYMRLSIELL